MARHNEILHEITDDAIAPIFWADHKGTVIAMDWAEGFLRAITLRAGAWEPLFKSRRDGKLLFPILSLCCDKDGESLLGLPPEVEDSVIVEAPEFIPRCVFGIADYWRRKAPRQIGRPSSVPNRTPPPSKSAATIHVLAALAESSKGAAVNPPEQKHRITAFTGRLRTRPVFEQPVEVARVGPFALYEGTRRLAHLSDASRRQTCYVP
jgi:hypothetical protein